MFLKALSKSQKELLLLAFGVKLLLYPAYRSTDFEVHRNWLAITHNLPLSQWYIDKTSQWTLDYPPFFAYFSYLLTIPAKYLLPTYVSEEILKLSESPVETWQTVAYMRTTVLLSEVCLALGAFRLVKSAANKRLQTVLSLAIVLHPGFLILDSIHFQYNGFLFGLMLFSLHQASEDRPFLCALFFATLLNFKHIYVYLAPAWFVFLFRRYCYAPSGPTYGWQNFGTLARIGVSTVIPFMFSLGPFIYLGQTPQLLGRLFPFTRGLMHAYWAPNMWALVTLTDRVLLKVASKVHWLPLSSVSAAGVVSTSRGLVGDTHFAILPDIQPGHCFLLTIAVQTVLLSELWIRPNYTTFLRGIVHCGFTSFMFGWHVHEKAIMLVLVPLSLLAVQDENHYRAFMISSVAGIYSLFPLLYQAAETPIKLIYTVVWWTLTFVTLRQYIPRTVKSPSLTQTIIYRLENIYLAGFCVLQLTTSIILPLLASESTRERWEFLPLMVTSIYCSLGLIWSWGRLVYASAKGVEEHIRTGGGGKVKGS